MKFNLICFLIITSLFSACQSTTESENPENLLTEEQYYTGAVEGVKKGKYNSALLLLRQSLENGLESPMDLVRDTHFYKLVDEAEHRPIFRNLLKSYAKEHETIMVRPEEPGEMISVGGQILDESTRQPLQNVLVELVQADKNGLYFKEKSKWNPRIFAYLKTDKNGRFSVYTIQPGTYKDDDENEVPAHIHFTLEANNYRQYTSEFTFDIDSVFMANGNVDSVPVATLKKGEGVPEYEVQIFMQKE